jgi:hypothetical protein
MNRHYYILILLLISLTTHAQPYETNPDFNRTRNWHFGEGIGLRFDPDTFYIVQSNIKISEANTIHTDEEGNLLLYSNGEKIWNANHEVIHNGNLSLGSYDSRMGSIFIIHPENPDYIYLFNTNYVLSANKELTYSLIIKEADTFRIEFKDAILMTGLSEPIAVVKANNGRDIWIVTHVFNGSNFVSFRLTKEGLIGCPVISSSKSYVGGHYSGGMFDMIFSPCGKYLIKVNTNIPPITKSVELYAFNAESGNFASFLYSIDSLIFPVESLCFSKDSKGILISERDSFLNYFNFYPLDSLLTTNSRRKFKLNGYKLSTRLVPYKNEIIIARLETDLYLDLFTNIESLDSVILSEKKINLNSRIGAILPNFNQSFFYTPSINFTDKTLLKQTIIVGIYTKMDQHQSQRMLRPP